MGHSLQEAAGRQVIINDHDLTVLIALLSRSLSATEDLPSELVNRIDEWVHSRDAWGPGLIDLKLDEVVQSEPESSALIRLLGSVEREAAGSRDTIPRGEISALLSEPSAIQTRDYPVAGLKKAVRGLIVLLSDAPG